MSECPSVCMYLCAYTSITVHTYRNIEEQMHMHIHTHYNVCNKIELNPIGTTVIRLPGGRAAPYGWAGGGHIPTRPSRQSLKSL